MPEKDPLKIEIVPRLLDLRMSAWDRTAAAVKTMIFGGLLIWVAVGLMLQLSLPKLRGQQRNRLAFMLAVPSAIFLAGRKFAFGYHRLACDGDTIYLQNAWRLVKLPPERVQGLIGTGGANFDGSETIVWRRLIVIADGKRYAISFDKLTNALCYQRLREICRHAWGLPFQGKLETPLAGPELDPDDYAESLRHVRRVYLLHTQQAMFSGLLMLAGSIAAGVGMATNMPGFGGRVVKLYFWLVVIGVVGLLLAIRALRQVPVLFSIRAVEQKLREAI